MSCSERAGPREFRLAVAWRCRPQYAQGWRYIDILTAVVKLSSVLPLSVRRPTHCIYTSYGRFYYCKILRGHLGTIPYAASLRYSLKVSTGTVHGASSQNRQNGGLAISLVAGDSNAPFFRLLSAYRRHAFWVRHSQLWRHTCQPGIFNTPQRYILLMALTQIAGFRETVWPLRPDHQKLYHRSS